MEGDTVSPKCRQNFKMFLPSFKQCISQIALSGGLMDLQHKVARILLCRDNADERCYYGEINKVLEVSDQTKYVVVNNVCSCLHLLLNSGI